MTKATQAEHHKHIQKRGSSTPKSHKLVDRLVFIAGPLIPLAIVPTAYDVVVNGQTEGINLITWGTLLGTAIVMTCYAVVHKEMPLIVTYVPLTILNAVIVVAVLLK